MSWYWWVIGPGVLVLFVIWVVVAGYWYGCWDGEHRGIEDPERLR